ncbi:MAG: glycosyltransferase [Terrimicrobiaceae bacterium]|nr:glycosyltransferase [Terrimicrobiaceae bacterium]
MRWPLALVCGFSAIFYLLTRSLLRRWLRDQPDAGGESFPPITFFRPIKSGEPGAMDGLAMFLRGVRPGDQVLVGVSTSADAEQARSLRKIFEDIEILVCTPGLHPNPKINKLAQLEPLARNDLWISLDSDTRLDGPCLNRLRNEWETAGTEALTAPYFFVETETLPARLDAAGTALGLWPGVAILRAVGPLTTLFGACLGVRATTLRGLGGWAAVANELAEDHALGHAVTTSGGRVHLASTAIPIRAGRVQAREWIAHQHRAFGTYHQCDPAGALGLPLTFGAAFSFLAFLIRPSRRTLGWHVLLVGLRVRLADALPGGPRHRPVTVWLASLVEPFFWLLGRLPMDVHWAGWRVGRKKIAPCPRGEKG